MKAAAQGAGWLADRGWFLLGGICETTPALVVVALLLYLQGTRLVVAHSRLEQAVALLSAVYLSALYLSFLGKSYRRLRAEHGK